MYKTLTVLLLLASLLLGCVPASTPTSPVPVSDTAAPAEAFVPTPEERPLWWDDAVFYEIFVRSFYDSDGDGIGDFNGVTEKLDYLNDGDPNTSTDLGVTGIWLMPIFPSPSYHGYDVTDYYDVNPQYGTMDDFKKLLSEAHKRGIRVIIDLVLNHTSDNHPWFKEAKSDANSPYRDWYIWRDVDPKYRGPWGERVWHPSPTGYYYGIFEAFMPDLNYNNPEVTQTMGEVATFWLKDIGVDGFRLDAAKHLIEEGAKQDNSVSTHKWYIDFRPVYKAANPEAVTVGEFFGDTPQTLADYTSGNQLDLAFNFNLAEAFIGSANTGQASYTANALKISNNVLPEAQYAPFLTNHDQNRVMSVLRGNTAKAKVAATLLLTAPGTPFIYYGEEIGMTGAKPDELIRTPMQWSAGTNAGFTTGTPWEMPNTDYAQGVNIAEQAGDPTSLLSHYRALIAIRSSHPALRTGEIYIFDTANKGLFASLRVDGTEAILVLVNLTEAPISDYALSLQSSPLEPGQYDWLSLLGGGEFSSLSVNEGGKVAGFVPLAEVPAYTTLISILTPIP
ncbi:MAG: alpha-amylase family glycosyl hydrolase [Chloroflexota bacterium]